MKLVYAGKTKDVYEQADGNYLLRFKDDVTGSDGQFDPGANTVGLTMPGAGRSCLRLSKLFFEKISAAGIRTHYLEANEEQNTMTVMPAEPFGAGVEVILRYRAVGSFYRRYGQYCNLGDPLPAYVEVTLKDDEREDPLITEAGLEALSIMSKPEYHELVELTKRIGEIVKEELAKHQLELYDIKFEFGRVGPDRHIALIDEISGGNMRAYRKGEHIKPLELEQIMVGE